MRRLSFCILIFGFCVSCATSFDSRGVYHRVRRGENLLWIAKSYGVELQDLAELNNIQNVNPELVAGEKLYIPEKEENGFKQLPLEDEIASHMEKKPAKRKRVRGKLIGGKSGGKILTEHNRFEWPVPGTVMSPFGIRHGRRHDGIDIKAPTGTPIRVADAGTVVYAGTMRGYGNLMLVRHKDNFFTAYAHNKKNGVRAGQKVKRGEVIGTVGRTGRATGAHLHFEIRQGEKARNPLFFLPVAETGSKGDKHAAR